MDATVVVTGATGGIGRAVARAFAAAGAHVVVSGRDREAIEELAADLDGEATPAWGDVRDEFDAERVMETASRAGERSGVDVVVPCAGVYHGDPGETPLDAESYSAFDDTMRTNVRGVFGTVKEALPHMPADGRVVVPTGSVAREDGSGYGSYAVSKAGVEALVRGFAADTSRTVGLVEPGVVATDLTGGQGRDPEDVAPLFVWAATVDADRLDGERLTLKEWRQATAD